MILAVDIGNTKTAVALIEGTTVHQRVSVPTDSRVQPNTLWAELAADLGDLTGLKGAIVCSVVPLATPIVKEAIRQGAGSQVIEFTAATPVGIINRYEPPTDVGADRLANAFAAWKMYGLPAIIVDIGTALTIDCINEQAEYLGGVIAPGVGISLDALHTRTALLPRVELEVPARVLGNSTIDSIRSGITHGHSLMIAGLVEKLCEELDFGDRAHIVITGGYTAVLNNQLRRVSDMIDPNLTLKGLALIYKAFREQETPLA